MGIFANIEVHPYRKWEKGTGEVVFNVSEGGAFVLDKEHIRKLYMGVLGLGKMTESIDSRIERASVSDVTSVDLPEDILVCQRELELERELGMGTWKVVEI